jgi:hypothetical protein
MLMCKRCGCGLHDYDWPSYDCRRCGAFNARLYRAEHADQALAATMTDTDLLREWRDAS